MLSSLLPKAKAAILAAFFAALCAWAFSPPAMAQDKRPAGKAPPEKGEKQEEPPGATYLVIEEVIAVDPGRMHEIKVKPGDVVKQGQLLGSLDYRRQWYALEVAKVRAYDRSKVREMQAEVSMNSAILSDHRERLRRRQVSEHAVAQSEARLSASNAKLESARAAQRLSELALEETQRAYDDRFFFAPINGVVISVAKNKHENVGAGNVVFTIGDNSSWVLKREVSPETAAQLFIGRTMPMFHAGSDVARLGRITNIFRQENGQHMVEMSVPNQQPTTQTAPPQFEEPKFLPSDPAPATVP
jgi:multidrug efflux pump subunit AcrA (membrane-fusion protein)